MLSIVINYYFGLFGCPGQLPDVARCSTLEREPARGWWALPIPESPGADPRRSEAQAFGALEAARDRKYRAYITLYHIMLYYIISYYIIIYHIILYHIILYYIILYYIILYYIIL